MSHILQNVLLTPASHPQWNECETHRVCPLTTPWTHPCGASRQHNISKNAHSKSFKHTQTVTANLTFCTHIHASITHCEDPALRRLYRVILKAHRSLHHKLHSCSMSIGHSYVTQKHHADAYPKASHCTLQTTHWTSDSTKHAHLKPQLIQSRKKHAAVKTPPYTNWAIANNQAKAGPHCDDWNCTTNNKTQFHDKPILWNLNESTQAETQGPSE